MGEKREWLLWGLAALLCAVVVALAWLDVPELSPVAVTYPSEQVVTEPIDMATTSSSLKINLNTADAATLMQLDGLGEKTAAAILDYRESHGGFDTVEELQNVKGIGEKKLAEWAPYLTVSE